MSRALSNDDNSLLENDFEYGGHYEENSSGTSGDESSVASSSSDLSGVMELQ